MAKKNTGRNKFHYAWVILIVAILILGSFMPAVTSLANKWQIPVTSDLGFSRSAFSLNSTIVQAVGIFTGPIISRFLSQYDFKKLWTGFAVLFSLSLFGYSFSQTPLHFYIASFLLGLSFIGTTSIPMTMLINNWFIAKRGLATSIAFAGISAGGFILSPVITYLITQMGWRQAYFAYGIWTMVLALGLGIFAIRFRPKDMGLEPYGAHLADEKKIEQDEGMPETSVNLDIDLPISQSWTKLFFIMLLLGAIANGLANGASLQFSPAIQEAQGPAVESITVSAYLLVGTFGKLLLGWINDKFGIQTAIIAGMGALALSFVAMFFIHQPWGPYALVITFGLGVATGTVLPPILTAAIYDTNRYGEAYGYVTSTTQMGTAVGPLIVPLFFDNMGTYAPAWVMMFVLAVMGLILWTISFQSAKKIA